MRELATPTVLMVRSCGAVGGRRERPWSGGARVTPAPPCPRTCVPCCTTQEVEARRQEVGGETPGVGVWAQ